MWTQPTQDVVERYESRVAELRREIHGPRPARPDRRLVRRWVGRQLVRAGTRLAADPSLRPVRSY